MCLVLTCIAISIDFLNARTSSKQTHYPKTRGHDSKCPPCHFGQAPSYTCTRSRSHKLVTCCTLAMHVMSVWLCTKYLLHIESTGHTVLLTPFSAGTTFVMLGTRARRSQLHDICDAWHKGTQASALCCSLFCQSRGTLSMPTSGQPSWHMFQRRGRQ